MLCKITLPIISNLLMLIPNNGGKYRKNVCYEVMMGWALVRNGQDSQGAGAKPNMRLSLSLYKHSYINSNQQQVNPRTCRLACEVIHLPCTARHEMTSCLEGCPTTLVSRVSSEHMLTATQTAMVGDTVI